MAARRSLTGGSMRHWQPDRSTMQGPWYPPGPVSFALRPAEMRQDPSRVYPATSDIRRQLAASDCGRGSGDNPRKEAHKPRSRMVLPGWAEGVGFEPTMTVTSHSGFQDPYGNRSGLHRYPVRLVASARIRHDQRSRCTSPRSWTPASLSLAASCGHMASPTSLGRIWSGRCARRAAQTRAAPRTWVGFPAW